MKQITLTAVVFLFSLSLYACSTDSSTSDNIQETSVSVTEYKTVTSSVSSSVLISSVSESSTASVSTSASESSVTSKTEETTTETLPYDYNDVELSILSNMDNPDYTAEVNIPYVAWTEINLQKTMYTISGCSGYEFALPEASKKVIYDAGCALNVIARTSTGYYRIDGDIYIPCDFLDNSIPDSVDTSTATSCAVTTIAVTTAVSTQTT